jgi:hypothetical protein
MSSTIVSHHRTEVKKHISEVTALILAEERSITASLHTVEFLSALRKELTDSLVEDNDLVTPLIDTPMLRGGCRLSVGEATRIIQRLTDYVEGLDSNEE